MTSPSSSEPPAHLLQVTTANHHNPTSSSSSSLAKSSSRSPRGGGGGQNQACAACKYQRRKCNPDCPLARYFPAEHQRRFLNAHRLFGVSNIQKTLRDTDPEFQPDAMRALVFQAEARALDPVKGCWGIITDLEAQFHLLQLESAAVRYHLDLCRQQAAAVRHHLDQGMLLAAGPAHEQDDDAIVHALYADQETAGQANGGAQDHFALDQAQPMPQQRFFYYDDEASSHAWSKVDNSAQQQYGNGSAGFKAGGSPVALGEQLEQNCQIEAPFVDVFNLKHEITTTMEDNGLENDLEEKVLTVVKNEVEGTQMAESSAAAHCQLELGFSSF